MKKWIIPFIKQNKILITITAVVGMIGLLCGVALMFISGFLISKAALRPENILMIYVPIVAVRAFGVGRAAFQYVFRYLSHDTILRILASMRNELYRLLEPAALWIHSKFRTGDLLGILADDIEHLQDVYLRTILPSVMGLGIYGVFVFSLGLFDWVFALLIAFYGSLLVIVIPFVSLAMTRLKTKQLKSGKNRLYQKLTDAILGLNDWMITGRHGEFIADYEKNERALLKIESTLQKWRNYRDFMSQLIVGIMVLSMIFWTNDMVSDGRFSLLFIAAFVLVVFTVSEAFLPVTEAVEKFPSYQDSFARLEVVERELAPYKREREHLQQKTWGKIHIHVDDVYYRYSKNDAWALQHIHLDLPQGKKIAILGKSGAGKSTLTKLICGLIEPEKGRITLNGQDAYLLGDDIFQSISILNQRPHLFDTTVANNIRLGKKNASMEEIYEAAKQVRMHDYIMSLPKGYDTPMLETAQNFSGGERQRIALARILLKDTPVVILDEPTVGLDPTTEKQLLQTIFTSLKGKTIIWITHHLIGVNQMDEVVFLENGKIEMQGSHEELLKTNKRYRNLYELDVPNSVIYD